MKVRECTRLAYTYELGNAFNIINNCRNNLCCRAFEAVRFVCWMDSVRALLTAIADNGDIATSEIVILIPLGSMDNMTLKCFDTR